MLQETQILENYSKFTNGCKKFIPNSEKLLAELGEDIQIAPASTALSLHCAYPGGLVEHILEIVKCANRINKTLDEPINQDSLMRVTLLAEIGKAKLYIMNTEEWSRTKQGKMYNFNEELASMKVGERSLYYALSYGCELTEDEAQAILNYEKEEDKSVRWHTNPIGKVLRTAIDFAIINEKKKEKNG